MQDPGNESGYQTYNVDEAPNENAQSFYDMLSATQAPLYPNCEVESELSAAVRMLSIKFDYNITENGYNEIMQFMHDTMPTDNRVPTDFYHTKKLVSQLGSVIRRLIVVQMGVCCIIRTTNLRLLFKWVYVVL